MHFFKDFWNPDVVSFEDSSRCKASHKRHGSARVCYIIDLDKYTMRSGHIDPRHLCITYVLSIVLLGSRQTNLEGHMWNKYFCSIQIHMFFFSSEGLHNYWAKQR